MPDYAYRAIDPKGREKTGRLTAASDDAARAKLTERNFYVVKMEAAQGGKSKQAKASAGLFGPKKLTSKELTLFTRQLSSLAQVSPLEEALRLIGNQNEKPHVQQRIATVHGGVIEGQRLSEAMRREPKSFPPLYRAMIAAGESSGTLPDITERLADLLERQAELRGKLIGTLAYPIVLALVSIIVVALLMIAVVPKVVEQFDDVNQQLPMVTRIVIGISSFLADWWWAIAIVIGLAALIGWRALKEPQIKYRFDGFLLRLPFFGRLLRDLHAARLARTLSTMVASRLPIIEGLKLTTNTIHNSVLRRASEDMVEAIRGGGSLSTALKNSGVFPPMLVYMTSSGEASGQLDDMLARAAGYLEREFDNFSSTALSLLEPLIIVGLGGLVAVVILAILLPILQLQNLAGL
ncbi:MAG: type II secretion system inner membrane protein GspF [Sphingomonadales bacterium]|nr:type II secretion system inner membrane protein GspF [Sphingomonadales bacterium]PIX67113.1 MAG: type II secretion system protein GspF [Sphingomonadales bacterium CG_4_10_14_3_um_filter_58_15]NCO49898.1 type II secretion system inner membrane protein GspF [Sphingomonadales bacterium]NCP00949.1 type II secretion system inner membrane protein GspF [Sphingomonadales bacterium]NCP27993.1 type II secretion system inner membrane protein GspF [Sphingomonadales bacterium]